MLKIPADERRRRLGTRHALAPAARAPDPVAAAGAVVAVHATDPATVFLALAARVEALTPHDVQDALYLRRDLVRMLGMRRTMFVVPSRLLPVIEASTMERVAGAQRRLLVKHLSESGLPDAASWLADVEAGTLAALAARGGSASAVELAADEPRLRTTVLLAAGKPYEARPAITSRVLTVLGAQGHLVRGRPSGSWLSQRYQWALADQWLPGPTDRPPADQARVELARAWLTAYGPASAADLRWWTGWTGAQVAAALAALAAQPVDLDGQAGLVLPDDLDPTPDPGQWVALLPALDPTTMGWAGRDWYLGDHTSALFDTTGNAGPTIWLDGRVIGGWAQRADGEVVVRLLADVGAEATALVETEAERRQRWLAAAGDARIVPRFRTPTERDLTR